MSTATKTTVCATDDCNQTATTRGWCHAHYQQWWRANGNRQTCTIDGCTNALAARGWCTTHYDRWRRYGNPTEPPHKAGRRESDASPSVLTGRWIFNPHKLIHEYQEN